MVLVVSLLTSFADRLATQRALLDELFDGDTLGVEIEDRGVGFDPEPMSPSGSSIGLAGMIERAKIVGGRLIIETSPGVGTRISVELPLTGPPSEDVPRKPDPC